MSKIKYDNRAETARIRTAVKNVQKSESLNFVTNYFARQLTIRLVGIKDEADFLQTLLLSGD